MNMYSIDITSLETVKTVKNRMKLGEIIRDKFASRMLGECSLKEGISSISSEYSRPATKGDLCLLAYEIMQLRKTVEWGAGTASDYERPISQKEEVCPTTLKRGGGDNGENIEEKKKQD